MSFSDYTSITRQTLGKMEGANNEFTLQDAISFENATNWFSRKFRQIVFRFQGKGQLSEENLNKFFNNLDEIKLSALVKKCHSLLDENLPQALQPKDRKDIANLVDEYVDEKEEKVFKNYVKKNKQGLEKVINLFDTQIVSKHERPRKQHNKRVAKVRSLLYEQLQRQAKKTGAEIGSKKFEDLSNKELKELKVPYLQEIRNGKIKHAISSVGKKVSQELEEVQKTQNPVKKLEPEFYLSSEIQHELNKEISWKDVEFICEKRQLSSFLTEELKQEFNKNAENQIERILKIIDERVESKYAKVLKKELESLNLPVDFSKIETYVKRDEILTAIRIQEDYQNPQEIKDGPDYIQVKDLTVNVKNLNVYVKLSDIIAKNSENTSLKYRLIAIKEQQEAHRFSEEVYAFKTGIENQNEVRGYKLLSFFGLNRYIVPKAKVTLTIGSGKNEIKKTGIAGTWIKSKEFYAEPLYRYQKTKQEYEVVKTNDRDVSEISKDLERRKEILKSAGSPENIAELALIDAIFGSVDSHIAQYAVDADTKEFYCFDFARFLLPGMIYVSGERSFGMIRSAFLDHPSALEPLPENLIKKIKDLDLKDLEESIKAEGLIGSQEFFDQKVNEIKELKKDRPIGNIEGEKTQRQIVLACAKYEIDMEGKSFEALKEDLKKEIQERIEQIQEECFKQTHPKGFALMMKRLELLQEYLSSDKTPYTAQGAFAAMNPLLQPFVEVFGRCESNPHNLFHNRSYSLEDIIKWADEEGRFLVSDKERTAMREALIELKKPENCCSYEEVQTTIGFM